MVLANKITLGRIFLIPAVLAGILVYGRSVKGGHPLEIYRWIALGCFVVAAGSDALDGYIARKFKQRTWVGEIIDPVADKTLMVTSILALTFTPWPWSFPLWFPVLVVLRDLLAIVVGFMIYNLSGQIDIRIHWSGKAATFFQICSICWVMAGITFPHPLHVTIVAAVMTLFSGLVYLRAGVLQILCQRAGRPQ
jgi:cardiolipin synthase